MVNNYTMQSFQEYYLCRLDEITDEVADDLDDWADENPDLPFNDLFGGKNLRTVISFEVDEEALSILQKIHQAGMKIDYDNKLVYDPQSYEKGQYKRKQRIGKFLLGKKSPLSAQEVRWFQTQGDVIQALQLAESADKFSIIISRHPVDVARMSDHDGWSSCHAPPEKYGSGNYFHCALSDAKGGGAIAYIVKKKDAQAAMESDEWESDEIFEDDDRLVDGIKPISRVRLRMFVHKDDGYDLAVPEVRSYGKKVPGFKETVTKWAREKQWKKIGGKRVSMDDFERKGGSYQDSIASELFNSFFDDNLDSGDATYTGEDEGGDMWEQYEKEIRQLEEAHPQESNKYCTAWASVEDADGQPYVDVRINLGFDIPDDAFEMELPDWQNNWEERRKVRKAIEEAAEQLSGVYGIQEVDWDTWRDNSTTTIRVDIQPDCTDQYGNYIFGNPDCYREAIEMSNNIDKEGPKFEKLVYLALQRMGYLKSSLHQHLDDWGSDHVRDIKTFQNFNWDDDDLDTEGEIQVRLGDPGGWQYQKIHIGTAEGIQSLPNSEVQPRSYDPPYKHVDIQYTDEIESFRKILTDRLIKLAERFDADDQRQGYLWPEIKPEPKEYKLNIRPEIGIDVDHDGNVYMQLGFIFNTTQNSDDIDQAVNFVGFLDKRVENLQREAQQIWATVTRSSMQSRYQQQVDLNQQIKRDAEFMRANAKQPNQTLQKIAPHTGEPKSAG